MDKKVIDNLIDEIRKEKFIPFYYEDSSIRNNIREGNYRLTKLVGTIDYDEALTARALLKNYVLYAYNSRTDEFFENYSDEILSWQMDKVPLIKNDEEN